jgi:hypothetical protein
MNAPQFSGSVWQRACQMPWLVGWILGGMFLLLGGVLVVATWNTTSRLIRSFGWQEVPGRVLEVEVTTVSGRRRGSSLGVLKLRAEFQWQGRTHVATDDSIMYVLSGDMESMNARAASLRQQPLVPVLVDPFQPDRSALRRGYPGDILIHGLFLLFPAFGAGATLVTALAFLYRERGRPRRGILGAWGVLERWLVLKEGWTTLVIRLLVLIPMTLGAVGLWLQNWLLVAVGAYIGYGVWKAARPERRRGR